MGRGLKALNLEHLKGDARDKTGAVAVSVPHKIPIAKSDLRASAATAKQRRNECEPSESKNDLESK